MILITYKYRYEEAYIKNVWEVDVDNPEDLYRDYMISSAEKENIVINPHWLNIMNHKDHHPNLSESQYKDKVKLWKKYRKTKTFEDFIECDLGGIKIEFKETYL